MRYSGRVFPLVLCLTATFFAGAASASAQSVTYGVHSPQLSEIENLTARAMQLHRRGNAKAAVPVFKKAADKARRHFGASHPKFARTLNNLAIAYDLTGALDRAEKSYRQAIAIVAAHQDARQQQLANLENNLATVVLQQCRIADAQHLYRQALVRAQAALGAGHADTVMMRRNVERLDRYLGAPQPASTDDLSGDFNKLLRRCLS